MALVEIGSAIAEELHGIASLDEGEALCQQAFEVDRADFRAVLLLLAALLGALIVVEFALDAAGGTMEQVDSRPQQIIEIGFEASITQGCDQGIEDVVDGATDEVCLGQRARIGLVLERTPAVELELRENVRSRGGALRVVVAIGRHGDALRGTGRAHRGLRGDHPTAGGPGPHRGRPKRKRRTAGGGYFVSRCKAGGPCGLPREASGGGK
jgi:hypothetical protein